MDRSKKSNKQYFNTVVGGKCTQVLYTKLSISLAMYKENKVLSALRRIFYIKPLETGIGVYHMEAA